MAASRFIVADDHPLFRAALAQVLAASARVDEAGDLEELIALLGKDGDVDLVLLDLNMPGAHGFSGLLLVRAQFPQVPVLIVTAVDDADVRRRCLALGAAGFLNKSAGPAEIRAAVDAVMGGNLWPAAPEGPDSAALPAGWQRLSTLSAQQVRVLMKLSAGLMNKQIAHELSIAEATVKAHVSAILQRLGVNSRTQAALLATSLERSQPGSLTDIVER